jgi:hypothetical protein
LRFYAAAELAPLEKLASSNADISFFATIVSEEGIEVSTPVKLGGVDNSFDTAWRVLSADTQALDENTYNKNYSMRFWAVCTYSDGSMQACAPKGIYCERSATTVASAALADTTVQYDQKIVEHLLQILDAVTA